MLKTKGDIKNRKVSKREVIPAVIEFIEFYNTKRPKKRLGFLSPEQFRLLNPRGTYPVVMP